MLSDAESDGCILFEAFRSADYRLVPELHPGLGVVTMGRNSSRSKEAGK